MNASFPKEEKLKSRKEIARLFSEGNTIAKYPIRLLYVETSANGSIPIKAAVSVSKRNFKKAVDRNHIKRLLREGYRNHKGILLDTGTMTPHYSFLWLYTAKEMTAYTAIDTKIKAILTQFAKKHLM